MPRNNNHSFINLAILGLLALGLFYLFSPIQKQHQEAEKEVTNQAKSSVAQPQEFNPPQGGGVKENVQAEKNNAPPLLVVRESEVIELVNGKEKKLFTQPKIQTYLGILDNQTIIGLEGKDQQFLVQADTLNKLTLQPFIFTPAISSDGQRVAMISFNNAETNFGFTLEKLELNSGQKTTVAESKLAISLPQWNFHGTRIVYVEGSSVDQVGQKIILHDFQSSTDLYQAPTNQVITDLAWVGDQKLAFTLEPLVNNGYNEARVMLLNINTKTYRVLIDRPGKERSLAGSPDGQWLAMIAGKMENGQATTQGDVAVVDLSTGDYYTLGKAQEVIGWRK